MKHYLIGLIFWVCLWGFVWAQDCPFGVENDPAPWQCGLYTDENANNFCDHGESNLDKNEPLDGEEDHNCEENINSSDGEISWEEMKNKSIAEVATLYNMPTETLISLLSSEVKITLTPDMSLRMLHDEYWLKMSTVKTILEQLPPVPDEWESDTATDSQAQSVGQYLSQFYFQYLWIIVLFSVLLFWVSQRSKTLVKQIIFWLLYIILPLFALVWPIYLWYAQQDGPSVFALGRHIGYACIWLLFVILAIKPICLLSRKNSSNIGKTFAKYFAFIVAQKRALGIATFYLALGHFLGYFSFWIQKWLVSTMIFKYSIIAGVVGFAMLFVAWLTSNNFSIKKLWKRRKPVQMLSYLALIGAVVHIFLINKQTWLFFIILSCLYFVLKTLEWTKRLR